MAGRGAVVALVGLFIGIIALQAFAFIAWDIGTRAPERLVRDVAAGFRNASTMNRGIRAFATGALATAAAQILLGMAERGIDSLGTILGIEALVVCAALIAEMTLGPLARARFGPATPAPPR